MDPRLPPHGEPVRPLTRRQQQVADLLPLGLSFEQIGQELDGISDRTVRNRVDEIATLIPNPDELEPEKLVRLWACWRFWRHHFDHHPRVAQAGAPPITSGASVDCERV